jgi:hypothetical protein
MCCPVAGSAGSPQGAPEPRSRSSVLPRFGRMARDLDVYRAEIPGVLPESGAHVTQHLNLERMTRLRVTARGVSQGAQDMSKRIR